MYMCAVGGDVCVVSTDVHMCTVGRDVCVVSVGADVHICTVGGDVHVVSVGAEQMHVQCTCAMHTRTNM